MAGWIKVFDSTAPLENVSDVTVTSITSGEILAWTGAVWENQTLAELGIAATTHDHDYTGFPADTQTISTGAITLSNSYTIVAAESGVADDLTDITAGTNGDLAVIKADTGDTITVKTTGNIVTISGADVSMTDTVWLLLWCDGTNWQQIGGTDGYPGSSSPLTTKGDIFVYSTADDRLPVGSDGYLLKANSADPTGLQWTNVSNLTAFGSTFADDDMLILEDISDGTPIPKAIDALSFFTAYGIPKTLTGTTTVALQDVSSNIVVKEEAGGAGTTLFSVQDSGSATLFSVAGGGSNDHVIVGGANTDYVEINPFMRIVEQSSSPGTPATGYGYLYCKTDQNLYFKDDAGTETALGFSYTAETPDIIGLPVVSTRATVPFGGAYPLSHRWVENFQGQVANSYKLAHSFGTVTTAGGGAETYQTSVTGYWQLATNGLNGDGIGHNYNCDAVGTPGADTNEYLLYELWLNFDNIPTNHWVVFGLLDADWREYNTAAPNDGIYFNCHNSYNSGNFQGICTSGGVSSTTNLGVAPSGAWHRFKCTSDGGSNVRFWYDGSQVGSTITSNIPATTLLYGIWLVALENNVFSVLNDMAMIHTEMPTV